MTDARPADTRAGRTGPADSLGARRGKKTRGVTAGRIVAAGAGVAAMLGLAAQMQPAGGDAAANGASAPAQSVADARVLRWEHDTYQAHGTDGARFAADERAPIVLTPHTIVNTVGGGSGGSGSAGYSAPSYSAPAAAPVASSGGSAPR